MHNMWFAWFHHFVFMFFIAIALLVAFIKDASKCAGLPKYYLQHATIEGFQTLSVKHKDITYYKHDRKYLENEDKRFYLANAAGDKHIYTTKRVRDGYTYNYLSEIEGEDGIEVKLYNP
ncbi:hypothetical protein [Citrobacter portucalensis]|uniref:hypothetical protein n=1 Tax=Citrobacter portucalensis TaxID=1639133 RepID=UPI00254B645D|nr:hypothetical protein [Citrobacter portucalensis]